MSTLTQLLIAIGGLAIGTFAFRVAGPLLGKNAKSPDGEGEPCAGAEGERRGLPPWLEALMSRGAVVLLIAVVASTALTEEQGFAGIARPAGVLVGGVLAWLKVPFIVVILAAAAVAAGLRLMGVA
ncbi:AzlD domain-containing protein [Spelaeicoccus albus]|uniref:Branched-subunit amino acid transport protein n=1 Tax=Spelaeicoccus albus TaxID=1280376 RepID=A0A7Z0A9V6_9MICO|nr:AzlD domain-containing protein [Spelaeicoccus albus]NYI66243.1 branched-subunit amino acid transport protein [Spelaeicoccus albus]